MFKAIAALGSVAVKLVYYRGESEVKANKWHDDPAVLSDTMRRLSCRAGSTQIARVLRLALAEKERLSGVVLILDHCEERSPFYVAQGLPDILADRLIEMAESLGKRSIPLYIFHEIAVRDTEAIEARPLFRRMAEVSGGVYSEFQSASVAVLRELLSAVAAFSAAGIEGVKQIEQATTPGARWLQTRLLLGPAGDFGERR